jgi:hypothetical protein
MAGALDEISIGATAAPARAASLPFGLALRLAFLFAIWARARRRHIESARTLSTLLA